MPTSDSEDFESADEGQNTPIRKERKQRLSSSNYSENTLESDQEVKTKITDTTKHKNDPKPSGGWDDFDIEDDEILAVQEEIPSKTPLKQFEKPTEGSKQLKQSEIKQTESSNTGWDDFDDWGDDDNKTEDPYKPIASQPQKQNVKPSDANIEEVTTKLANTTTANTGGWGWGWSVDSLLTTATAGISTLTNQVSQGISTVLETGIGAPDPEELARQTAKERETTTGSDESRRVTDSRNKVAEEGEPKTSDAFQFRGLFSEVTKFVESTGTKVISGGLGTLETIGKKTMEVLQDGDPGLAKKRAMLGLASEDKPVLSQILREAKAKADEEDRVKEVKKEAKEVHYETLFDDFEGLVHLEALEMLSRQVNMRIEERMRGVAPEKRQDLKETLQQVAELCEMPDEDDDNDCDEPIKDELKAEDFHERLQTATQDLGLKLQFQPIVKQYTDILEWASQTTEVTEKQLYKCAVSSLAQATALSVELYHKAGEMLLVKPRRSTADEADALTQMTVVLTKHVTDLATHFTDKLNALESEDKEQTNNYITNIFLEAGNSSTYIHNAFQLALPILQIGAV